MTSVGITLLASIIGGLIATTGSVITTLLLIRKDSKRHRREIATRLAIEDRNKHIEFAEGRAAVIYPVEIYVAYYIDLMDRLEKGSLTDNDITALGELMTGLRRAYDARQPAGRARG